MKVRARTKRALEILRREAVERAVDCEEPEADEIVENGYTCDDCSRKRECMFVYNVDNVRGFCVADAGESDGSSIAEWAEGVRAKMQDSLRQIQDAFGGRNRR